eukprot:GHVH01004652.1.p1 GENE.GHVH01004652.1~~GHVH01004652.1.p1  ORF type:complete len:146 (+),score=15.04 GHVH01004652.1:31-468(+)
MEQNTISNNQSVKIIFTEPIVDTNKWRVLIHNADIIICHAGVGSLIHILQKACSDRLGRTSDLKCLVFPNSNLSDDHQMSGCRSMIDELNSRAPENCTFDCFHDLKDVSHLVQTMFKRKQRMASEKHTIEDSLGNLSAFRQRVHR